MMLAGIVLYNPEEKRLEENIMAIEKQVDKIILIDNDSRNYEIIKNKYIQKKKIDIIHNEKNEGIAYALNQILKYAVENNYNIRPGFGM